MISLTPFAPLAAALWLLSPAAVWLMPGVAAEGATRSGLWIGWATAGGCGLLSFGLLWFARRRSLQVLLASVLFGFLARLLLVAAAVVLVAKFGYGDASAFCLSFFGLYWVLLSCEFLTLRQGMRRPRLDARTAAVAS